MPDLDSHSSGHGLKYTHVQKLFGLVFFPPCLKGLNLSFPKAELTVNPTVLVSALLDFTAVTVCVQVAHRARSMPPFLKFRFVS